MLCNPLVGCFHNLLHLQPEFKPVARAGDASVSLLLTASLLISRLCLPLRLECGRLWALGRRRYHPARLLGVWLIELVGTSFGVPSARRLALPRASGDLNRSASREHAAKRAVGSPRGSFSFLARAYLGKLPAATCDHSTCFLGRCQ